MSLAEYLKEKQIDDIEDDQEFMDAEYHAIRTYCEIYGYSLTDADLKTVKSRGLEESFISWQERYITCKLENDVQFERLYQNLTADIQTVYEAERLFGHACFTEDAREKIAVLDFLLALFEFSGTAEEFNEELRGRMETMICDKALKRMGHYISRQIKQ